MRVSGLVTAISVYLAFPHSFCYVVDSWHEDVVGNLGFWASRGPKNRQIRSPNNEHPEVRKTGKLASWELPFSIRAWKRLDNPGSFDPVGPQCFLQLQLWRGFPRPFGPHFFLKKQKDPDGSSWSWNILELSCSANEKAGNSLRTNNSWAERKWKGAQWAS